LNPIRVAKGDEAVDVLYPPIPTRLLQGIKGVRFPLDHAVGTALDMAAALLVENVLLTYLTAFREKRADVDTRQLRFHPGGRFGGMLSEIWEDLHHIGVVPNHDWEEGPRFHYLERNLDELLHRVVSLTEGSPELGKREYQQIRRMVDELVHRSFRGRGRFVFEEIFDRIEYILRRGLDNARDKRSD
jgi:hypothetical protein